jgi:hypothetical protein
MLVTDNGERYKDRVIIPYITVNPSLCYRISALVQNCFGDMVNITHTCISLFKKPLCTSSTAPNSNS